MGEISISVDFGHTGTYCKERRLQDLEGKVVKGREKENVDVR